LKTEKYKCGLILLTGFPNAGKSTLINKLVKKKISIVSSKVQTTRDEIKGIINYNETQLIFTDTPGIVERRKFNKKRISRTLLNNEIEIDCNLFIFDLNTMINEKILSSVNKITKRFKKNYLILNKIDLVERKILLEASKFFNSRVNFLDTFMISAKKNKGIDFLIKRLITEAPERDWVYEDDVKTNMDLSFRLSEVTREKVFQLLNKEIPYSIDVLTKVEDKNNLINIFQEIIVKKNSQKAIIIGKNGQKIKMIGTRSRVEMESLLGNKVFLNLVVKKN
jgi:GTP-binding protein Era